MNGKELKVAVIGAGSWGSVVATLLADKVKTVIWTRTPEVAESINCHHLNPSYLGPYQLSKNLLAIASRFSIGLAFSQEAIIDDVAYFIS